MTETLLRLNSAVNGLVWGWPMIVLLMGTGLLLTVLTGAVQIRRLRRFFREERVFVGVLDDLRDDREKFFRGLFEFLGLRWDAARAWVRRADEARYARGEHFDLQAGAWTTLAAADGRHASPDDPWVVGTEHFELRSGAPFQPA